MREGVHGLLRDKTRPSGKPPLATTVIERVIALTGNDPPGEATHWTAVAMAKSVGISISSVPHKRPTLAHPWRRFLE